MLGTIVVIPNISQKIICFSLGGRENEVVCNNTNNRVFFIKSAYHLRRKILTINEVSPS